MCGNSFSLDGTKQTVLRRSPVIWLWAAMLLVSPSLFGGDIYLYYTDLRGTLSLTTDQNGATVGDPVCQADRCTALILGLPEADFPEEKAFLVAGLELPGMTPRVYTDLAYFEVAYYEAGKPDEFCDPDEEGCDFASLLFTFYPYPFNAVVNLIEPTCCDQPPADRTRYDVNPYFVEPNLATGNPVGFPSAAIYVFMTADGSNVTPEPGTVALLSAGVCFLFGRKALHFAQAGFNR
jgi:hypothetical protein